MIELKIERMTCGGCAATVRAAVLDAVPAARGRSPPKAANVAKTWRPNADMKCCDELRPTPEPTGPSAEPSDEAPATPEPAPQG